MVVIVNIFTTLNFITNLPPEMHTFHDVNSILKILYWGCEGLNVTSKSLERHLMHAECEDIRPQYVHSYKTLYRAAPQ